MSRRRRYGPPLVPGLWIILAAALLIGSVALVYYTLADATVFERSAVKAAADE